MTTVDRPDTALAFRPATPADLVACATIWRIALNDYLLPRGEPEIPVELGPLLRLFAHLQRIDPAGFVVAEDDGRESDPVTGRIVGFASSYRRGGLWFLSMLFVLPDAQSRGLGRELLRRVAPTADDRHGAATWRATATDSAQPISNGLYASLGIVPRMPVLRLVGRAERAEALSPLPSGVEAIPFETIESVGLLAGEIDGLDLTALGYEHPEDHGYLAAEGRLGYLYRDASGGVVGYGYTSAAGRVGPIAVREASLLAPIAAHLVTCIEPRGAFAIWAPGAAGELIGAFLRAGFRIEGFPVLLCWDAPFADFGRYVPISLGLL